MTGRRDGPLRVGEDGNLTLRPEPHSCPPVTCPEPVTETFGTTQDQIEAASARYRSLNHLAPDAPLHVIRSDDPARFYVTQPDTWNFIDGGTLDIGVWRDAPYPWLPRLRRRIRLMCDWVRYAGWR